MRKFIPLLVIPILFIFLMPSVSFGANWKKVVNLEGYWSFTLGDDENWSEPKLDTKDWETMYVPQKIEQVYEGYNGFCWYRKSFDVSWDVDDNLVLFLGYIDDVDAVFINGIKVGQTGSFPPNYETASSVESVYHLSPGVLKKTGNVIAVRVYDEAFRGGIAWGEKIGLFYDDDRSFLSLDLSGNWRFTFDKNKDVLNMDFDDSNWNTILVPSTWESQGYRNIDGYAWYRKEFVVSERILGDEQYLFLGKIDDMDKVYMNGELIGRTEYLETYKRRGKNYAYKINRIYKIPDGLLKKKNVVVVEVYDEYKWGGIYEGPIGLMNYQNAQIFIDKDRRSEINSGDFWENTFKSIIKEIFY